MDDVPLEWDGRLYRYNEAAGEFARMIPNFNLGWIVPGEDLWGAHSSWKMEGLVVIHHREEEIGNVRVIFAVFIHQSGERILYCAQQHDFGTFSPLSELGIQTYTPVAQMMYTKALDASLPPCAPLLL